jgi:hypothetical protein
LEQRLFGEDWLASRKATIFRIALCFDPAILVRLDQLSVSCVGYTGTTAAISIWISRLSNRGLD